MGSNSNIRLDLDQLDLLYLLAFSTLYNRKKKLENPKSNQIIDLEMQTFWQERNVHDHLFMIYLRLRSQWHRHRSSIIFVGRQPML